jgi:signal transduction histidine kinase
MIGKTCYEIYHETGSPVSNCPHQITMRTGKTAVEEIILPEKGTYLEVTTSPVFDEGGAVTATVHVARDITERKKMEEQLMIADRLASIGELASGIAHELNNPLTSVIGFSQLLLQNEIPAGIRKDLEVVYHEAQRTAEVVKNLLTFARKHTPDKRPVDINSVIKKVLELRTYEQKVNNIVVNTDLAPGLPRVMADYFQLQQVFLNIIINAEHFMIEANRSGKMTIVTGQVEGNVRAIFSDDGPGISPENLGHVFDPFFTTKEVGKGTGLGLSICHGIITEHSGRIYAESTLGKGASFIVELPVTES